MWLKEKTLQWIDPFIRLPVMGFDISDRSIKFVVLRARNGVTVEKFGTIDIPEGILIGGEIKKEDELIGILQSWFVKEGKMLRAPFVAACLPEEKSFLRLIQLPKVKEEDIPNAVRWEIETHIPLPPEELIFDYEIAGPIAESPDHVDVVVTAFPKAIVEAYVRTLVGAGLQLFVFELESQSIARAVADSRSHERALLLTDIGYTRTSFAICVGGVVIFTTTVEVGGKIFDENISRALRVDIKKAVEMKKTAGFSKTEQDGKIFSALAPALTTLADEIKRTTTYYENQTPHRHGAHPTIDEIILSGGDANLFGLETYLASTLKIPVRIGDSFAGLQSRLIHPIPPVSKNESPRYSAAIGLAMRGIRRET